MPERLGEAVLELDTDDRKYLQGVKGAETRANQLDRSLVKTQRSSKGLGTRLRALGQRLRNVAVRFATASRTGATTDGVFKRIGRTASTVRGQLSGLVAILGGAALISGIISTNTEFQSLQATLETFVGSAPKAAQVFDVLRDFAAATPFSVREVTRAFNRMLSVGITPSIRALQAFGNVASGSSKTVLDFVEAVADAAVGEFERLKEFGIKVRSEGDKVVFTFKGVETEVSKSAAGITDFLIKLGETEFAGAIERQAQTLKGAFSNAGDGVDAFFAKIGNAGFNQALMDVVRRFTDIIGRGDALAETISRMLTGGLNVLEAVFFGVARGIKFASDNGQILLSFLAGFIAMRVAQTVVRLGFSFLKLATAIRAAGIVMTVFAAIQNLTRRGLLVSAGLIAIVAGKWDDFKAAIDGVVEKVSSLVPAFKGEAQAVLKRLGFDISALEGDFKLFAGSVDESGNSVEDMDARLRAILGTIGKTRNATNELGETAKGKFKEMADAGRSMSNELLSAFDNFLETGKFKFSDFANSALKSLARIGADSVFKDLGNLVFGGSQNATSGGGSNTGGGFDLGSLFGGFFAGGGLLPANKFAVVGERGPELLVGDGRTRVAPLMASTGGGGITIIQNNDFSGVDPSNTAALDQRLAQLKRETIAEAVIATQDQRSRRPGMFGGRG